MTGCILGALFLIQAAAPDGFLGIQLKQDEDSGKPVIVEVLKGTPAEKAGLKADDLIDKLDGEAILSVMDLIEKVQKTKPGTEITLTVKRGKETKEIKAKVGEKPVKEDK